MATALLLLLHVLDVAAQSKVVSMGKAKAKKEAEPGEKGKQAAAIMLTVTIGIALIMVSLFVRSQYLAFKAGAFNELIPNAVDDQQDEEAGIPAEEPKKKKASGKSPKKASAKTKKSSKMGRSNIKYGNLAQDEDSDDNASIAMESCVASSATGMSASPLKTRTAKDASTPSKVSTSGSTTKNSKVSSPGSATKKKKAAKG